MLSLIVLLGSTNVLSHKMYVMGIVGLRGLSYIQWVGVVRSLVAYTIVEGDIPAKTIR